MLSKTVKSFNTKKSRPGSLFQKTFKKRNSEQVKKKILFPRMNLADYLRKKKFNQ